MECVGGVVAVGKIRLGLVGCGGMGQVHIRALEQLSDRVAVTAAVDLDEQRARAAAESLKGAKAYTNYKEALADVDGVMLVLPHHLHHSIAKDCLLAGKHVLLEKPMSFTADECLDLIKTARKADRTLMIAYCMRYHPLIVRFKQLLDEKTYGEVFQVSIWTEQYTYYTADSWRVGTLADAQLFSHGCHYIDLLLWFLGRPLWGAHFSTKLGTPWMQHEGTSNVTMEFAGGKLGYHFGTWGARGTKLGCSFQAHCTEGFIEADISGGKLIARIKGKQDVLMEAGKGKYIQNEIAHFIDCVATGKRPLTDGPGSLQGLRVIWRLYEAEEQRRLADLHGLGLDEYRDES